jgi:hypothetical protein
MPCENEFVPADSLPVDFFDPASIGYAEPDFEAELAGDFGITVYWLGEDFPGNAYLPPLTLSYVQTPRRVSDPIWGEQDLPLMLDYYLASDPYGEAAVWIQEYGLSEWNAKSAQSDNWWNGPCWDRQDIHLPNGNHATIISPIEDDIPGETCPSGPYDRFGALVYLGTSTIEVSGNFHDSGCGNPQIPITPPRE